MSKYNLSFLYYHPHPKVTKSNNKTTAFKSKVFDQTQRRSICFLSSSRENPEERDLNRPCI